VILWYRALRKRLGKTSQIRIEKMNENELLMKCRENEQSVQTAISLCLQDKGITGDLIYWLYGRRHIGSMSSIQA
jgi:hypothetical protein